MTLIAGTLNSSANSRTGQGELTTLTGAGALGQDTVLLTVPTNQIIYFNSMRAEFTTDATSTINRRVFLELQDPANTLILRLPWEALQAESQTKVYNWALGIDSAYDVAVVGGTNEEGRNPLPGNLYLPEDWQIGVHVSGIQAGDQIGSLIATGQRFVK